MNYSTAVGTAKPGLDYTRRFGTLTFVDGETVKTINTPLIDDLRAEPEETVGLILSNPQGWASLGAVTSATLTITDDAADVIAGDINNDKSVDLADLILALQIINKNADTQAVFRGSDINDDGAIGIDEVLYILQFISGLREAHVWP